MSFPEAMCLPSLTARRIGYAHQVLRSTTGTPVDRKHTLQDSKTRKHYDCTFGEDGGGDGGGALGTGLVSSIHLLGFFSTTVTPLRPLACMLAWASGEPSRYRPRVGWAGHGRIADAETVTTDARNVRPKRDEMKVRRWRWLRLSVRDTVDDMVGRGHWSLVSGRWCMVGFWLTCVRGLFLRVLSRVDRPTFNVPYPHWS